MAGFYNYPYILKTEEVCNKKYYHPTECKVYRNSSKQVPCINCNKLTFSDYSKKHSDKYQSREFYQQQKFAKVQANDAA